MPLSKAAPGSRLIRLNQEIFLAWQYNSPMFIIRTLLATFLVTTFVAAQEHVSFPTEDGGVVYGDVYGKDERGLVLAHCGGFDSTRELC
jgi:hypothetical protein